MSAATALAILAIPAGWAALDLPYQQRLLPGVVVRGVDLGGVPFDQAQVRLNQALRQRSERIMLLRAAGGEWGVQLDHLLSDPNDRAFDAARRYGHESSPPTRLRARLGALVGERQAFDDNPVDSAAVLQLVRQLRDHIDRPVRDAALELSDAGWRVTAAQTGLAIDQAAAIGAIEAVLRDAASSEPSERPLQIDLRVVISPPRYRPADLAPLHTRLEALRAAPLRVVAADRSWELDRSSLIRWAANGAAQLLDLAPDDAAIDLRLDEWAAAVDRPPLPSRLLREGDRVKQLVPGVPGAALDRQAAAIILRAAVFDGSPAVALPVNAVAPPPGEAEALGLVAEIGRGESHFVTYSSSDRDANVRAGGQDVDGVLVPPGGIFSFTATVGSITWDKGYRWGDMIEAGQLRPSLGGGICQVSTTVFRAALWSGLEIVERHSHSWRLPWYEVGAPPGMDATIALGGPDLKFRNNTAAHIVLYVETDLERKRQTVVIYGTPSSRRVEMVDSGAGSSFQIQRKVIAGDAVLLEDTFTSSYTQ